MNIPASAGLMFCQQTLDSLRCPKLTVSIWAPNGEPGFTLNEPRKIVVEVNGEIFDCLHLVARSIETDVPDPDDGVTGNEAGGGPPDNSTVWPNDFQIDYVRVFQASDLKGANSR